MVEPQRAAGFSEGLNAALFRYGSQAHPIGWKNHLVESLRYGRCVASKNEHIRTVGPKAKFQEGSQSTSRTEPAGLNQSPLRGIGYICAGLSLKEVAGSFSLEPEQWEG
jgi:hypothetical protein